MESSRACFVQYKRIDHAELHPQQKENDSQHEVTIAIKFHFRLLMLGHAALAPLTLRG